MMIRNLPELEIFHKPEQEFDLMIASYDDEGYVIMTSTSSPFYKIEVDCATERVKVQRDQIRRNLTERLLKLLQSIQFGIQAMLKDGCLQLKEVWFVRNKNKFGGPRKGTSGKRYEYDEVFDSVARIEAIRLFLAFASFMGFIVYQMDVKSAFLYGTIDEEVYVSQPPGFVDPDHPTKVYKVVKALYGLHQAPRAWYATLSTFLEKHGYKRGTIDKTLFIKRDKKDIMLVQVYVDDIIFGSTNKSWCDEFEALMKSRFQMSSMGELTFFLGLQVKQHKGGIFISQDKYVAEILKKFDLVNVKAAITPMETKVPLTKDEEAFDVDVHLYRSMIGSLMYLTASRPDIMYAVCVCSRFQVTPKTSHLNAVKRIFKYLKGKPNLGLWYPRESPFDLEAFSDSDYGGSNLDRKSTTGGCQFLGQRLISWQCKKQTIVATSTTEAEYVAAANCCGQVLWVQNQLLDYGFNFMNTKIHIDNESTICIVKNPVYHSKTKHIEIRHHFIRDCYEKKLISVEKIHTDLNVADLLTKPFDGPRFNYLVVSIGFAEIVDFLRGSNLRYALTANPTIYDSLVRQFWQTATTNTHANGTLEIKATIDTIRYTITEASIRESLQLEDATGITMLPNDELFEGMGQIGYPTDGTFTFWKSFFTPQWRYLVHHLLHCISSKSGGWDQFGSNIATALICLSTGRVYNFSKLIFDGMVANLRSKTKFLMYPRFLQMILNIQTENKHLYLAVSLTKKIFGNMKRGFRGAPRPLLPAMLLVATNPNAGQEHDAVAQSQPSSSTPLVPSTSSPQDWLHPSTSKVDASGEEQVEDISPNTLEAAKNSLQEEVDTGAEEVNTAEGVNTGSIKLSTVSEQVSTGSAKRWIAILAESNQIGFFKESGWLKQVHLDSLLAQRIAEEEELNEQQKKRRAQVQFEAQHYTNEDWDLIRAKIEANARVLLASLKKIGEELQTKTSKRLKSDEAKDVEPAKKSGKRRKQMARKGLHTDLDKDDSEGSDEVSKQDDSISGTKIPINPVPVAMKITSIVPIRHQARRKKRVYQIVREDGTDVVYINFGAMLKDISRDDLTELYRIVMNRYGMDGPEDELEKVFWKYLKNMFEEPLSTDPIWSLLSQQRIISWRYYDTCRVHCLNLESMDIYMLIERKYPLSAEICKAMLDKKLQGGKPDEDCYKMLKMMEKQAGIRK
ncbi:putative ribonuclease H-like domain-containing protein [Tanacetum coccineum]